MRHSAWRLKGSRARLDVPGLCATIDVAKPWAGLGDFSIDDRPLPGLHVLGVCLPADQANQGLVLVECYPRGDDLIARYSIDGRQQLSLALYWRVMPNLPGHCPGIDLLAAVNASTLDSRPEVATSSRIPANHAVHLAAYDPARWVDVAPEVGRTMKLPSSEAVGCLLFPLESASAPSDAATSYVEMIHPNDFHELRIGRAIVPPTERESAGAEKNVASPDRGAGNRWTASPEGLEPSRHGESQFYEASYVLFSGRLEKGVILRSRLRGAFLPRRDDLQAAARLQRQFEAEPPPLTA